MTPTDTEKKAATPGPEKTEKDKQPAVEAANTEAIIENADFSAEAKGIALKLNAGAKKFFQKLYERFGTPIEEGRPVEGFITKMKLKRDIYFSQGLEASIAKKTSSLNESIKTLQAQNKIFEASIKTDDENVARFQAISKEYNLSLNDAGLARINQERTRHADLIGQNEVQISQRSSQVEAFNARKNFFETRRQETVERLSIGYEQKVASNTRQIAENNRSIFNVSIELNERKMELDKAEQEYKKLSSLISGIKNSGFEKSDEANQKIAEDFSDQMRRRTDEERAAYEEVLQKKQKLLAANEALGANNLKLTGEASENRNKYLTPQEITARSKNFKEELNHLISEKDYPRATDLAINQNNFTALAEVAKAASETGDYNAAEDICLQLPEAARNQLIAKALDSGKIVKDQEKYLDLITDPATKERLKKKLAGAAEKQEKTEAVSGAKLPETGTDAVPAAAAGTETPNEIKEDTERAQGEWLHIFLRNYKKDKTYQKQPLQRLWVKKEDVETEATADEMAPVIRKLLDIRLRGNEIKKVPSVRKIRSLLMKG